MKLKPVEQLNKKYYNENNSNNGFLLDQIN